ncbi:MAG TPA: MarR family winged helix-turn-helix transcriptional regulator [Candidatus Dormibacteraeota bacterium]
MSEEPGFLIGAPLSILFHRLQRQVLDGLAAAGFGDLSTAYLPVFQLLGPDGGRVSDLARKAGTTKQAMSYLVAYLERRGYVERRPDPSDRRAQLVVRTARGWEVSRIAREVVLETQSEWARLLGAEAMADLLGGLRALVGRLGHEFSGSAADPAVVAAYSVPHNRSPISGERH